MSQKEKNKTPPELDDQLEEAAAKEAAGDLAELLLKSVTEGLSYEKLAPSCCKEVWYTAYRRFFWLLDKARK